MPTTVILIRHGESQSNLLHTFTGQLDAPLTPLGEKQAETTGRFLESYPITAVYSSPLARARSTAEATAKYFSLPVITDKRLREINGGLWQGMRWDEITVKHPADYDVWRNDFWNCRPTGGESPRELFARVNACVDDIVAQNRGGCVVITAHAAALLTVQTRWLGGIDANPKPLWGSNACVTVGEYRDDGNFDRLLLRNYDGHLSDMVTELDART